jgi:hypothetical protein
MRSSSRINPFGLVLARFGRSHPPFSRLPIFGALDDGALLVLARPALIGEVWSLISSD